MQQNTSMNRMYGMFKKRSSLLLLALAFFLVWNVVTYHLFLGRPNGKMGGSRISSAVASVEKGLSNRIDILENALNEQLDTNKNLLHQLKSQQNQLRLNRSQSKQPVVVGAAASAPQPVPQAAVVPAPPSISDSPPPTIAVLVISCNRPAISRCLDQLIKYRSSPQQFPIIVSQDCGHKPTADTIRTYGEQVMHIKQPDLSEIPLTKKEAKFRGYYNIARHYAWALNHTFFNMHYHTVLIVEDDLDVAPDFFEYFEATYALLATDSTLFCVSAWNDNGRPEFVDSNRPSMLYRTDFFPGLGWMLRRDLWSELAPKWPQTFWDDWLRKPEQRRDRSCIRPEISRTKTFGKIGVSKGQYFDKHLKFTKLNEKFVPFTKIDLSYLRKDNYDPLFVRSVFEATLVPAAGVVAGTYKTHPAVRVQYSTLAEYKATAKKLGIMDDVKSGVPRQAYRGSVPIMYNGQRVYISPPPEWKAYDPSWS